LKGTIKRMTRKASDWEKIFAKHILDKPWKHKEVLKPNDMKTSTQFKSRQKVWTFFQRKYMGWNEVNEKIFNIISY
jgi:hypothetical protein